MTDGAVGVTVDAPVTVSAENGVLGGVTMTNEEGVSVAGKIQCRRADVVEHRPSTTTSSTRSTHSHWGSVVWPTAACGSRRTRRST